MKETTGQKMTMQKVNGYLAQKGIPRQMVDAIRSSLIYDAMVEADNLKYDRIYSGIALMLHDEYGFGAQRIYRGLKRFDQICGLVLHEGDDDAEWPELMQRLKDETGIVVHTGEDNRLICEINIPD